MNLATIRSDLKARLGTISGLITYDTVPAKPEVPCAIVGNPTIVVHSTFERGSCEVRFDIAVLVQMAEWGAAQDALDGYAAIGATGSIVDALEAYSTGTEDVTVETIQNFGSVTIGEATYATATFSVVLMVSA